MIYDITALKRKVVAIYPFFGSIAASVEYQETEDFSAMESDGHNIYYNPGYMAGLPEQEQIFMLAHELCHIAFNHASRGGGRDRKIWQMAADAVVNQFLKRDGLELPAGAIDYPEAIDYDVEQYYEILMRNQLLIDLIGGDIQQGSREIGPGEGEGKPGGEADSEEEPMMENHETPAQTSLSSEEEDDEEDDELFRKLAAAQEQEEEGSEPQAPGEKQDEDDDDSEEEYTLTAKTVAKAGNSEKRDVRTVEEIGTARPIIDWRLLLRETINHGVDWSFTNAVLEDGIVRPTLEELPTPETEIVLDTSWSVDEDLLRNFLRECKNILQVSKMKAGCFDTVFYGFHDIRTEDDIETMVFNGGGGTDFNVAVDAFTLRVDNRIIFTDGEAPMPDQPMDAIWVVCGDKKIEPKGGTVIHVTPEQLARWR